jgi:DNA gyrase/topoisomerase IV subunit B
MSAEELKSTTLDRDKRRLMRVIIDEEVGTDQVINDLMGKDASARFRFIMERAADADAENLDV